MVYRIDEDDSWCGYDMCLRISIGCCREYESLERNTGTALFNTNCIFVYILSYMVLKDKTFSRDHFASLILTISGVVLRGVRRYFS